jgi:pimeloyl-ACP methyl ester carboxylesterase
MTPRLVDVGGRRLWTSVAGSGTPVIVFEAGGGDDSSVWSTIEPEVRQRNRVRTLVYDRAGLGKSDPPPPGEYRIGDEAAALMRVLDARRLARPIVLVAHSYGGFVALLVAAGDPRVAGVVLVDANLPSYFDGAVVERLLARYSPQFGELEQQAPELARVMIPLMLAYPDTVREVREVDYPAALPTIDIVAERSWGETAEENDEMRRAHADFVAAAPAVREGVLADGSGHYVMRDRPDVVLDAVARMVERLREA